MMYYVDAYVGFGSNLGDCSANLKKAIELLSIKEGIKLGQISSFYLTEPVGYKDQPYFTNAVCLFKTTLGVNEFFTNLKTIECLMGREKTFKWGPRKIDLDLLLYGDLVLNSPDLKIPHPLMNKRNFVLIPLTEIAPNLIHPVLQVKIQDIIHLQRI
ncbi:MAG: 2-amino-4-hydroxy-6-hydroxymethyldihydropteridine diphosphokinase [bacterium]